MRSRAVAHRPGAGGARGRGAGRNRHRPADGGIGASGSRPLGARDAAGGVSAPLSADGLTLTVRVPMTLRRRGGRKLVIAPDDTDWATARPRVDNAMVKALARAFRWRSLLETGVHGRTG